MKNKIVTRFAPSPTGYLHIGGARTALYIYLYTRQNNGKYILRIEDTDKERSKPEYEKDIVDNLKWLGLEHDEFVRQSDNVAYHQECLKKLLENNLAYVSKETIEKEGDREEVIRFRNPNKQVTFLDLIHGEIVFDTTDLGDFVIAKDLETPIFHLANVADDIKSGVTHIIRGEEHISNTPRQILLFEALGAKVKPTYAHIPLILDAERTKLSKRKHGESVWVATYKQNGYLPEALNNYLALLGWSPQASNNNEAGTDDEILIKEELLKRFDLSKVQKKGAIFDPVKLNWINREYLKRLSDFELSEKLKDFVPTKVLPLAKILIERVNNLKEVGEIIESGEFDFFFSPPEPSKELLREGKFLSETITLLEKLEKNSWSADQIKNQLWDFATKEGRGDVLWPMRTALTGQTKSPDPFTVASILGQEETLRRLKHAQEILN